MTSTTRTLLAAAAVALIAVGAPRADFQGAVDSFRPIATFNVPGGTSAEIVSATPDGRWLVYSDAIGQRFGLVDLTNPRNPQQVATLPAGGDPTSIVALPDGRHALGVVQPGRLVLIDLGTFTKVGERAIGEGPDSIAVTTVGGQPVAVIAIENEGAAKGFVEIVRVDLANFAASPAAQVRFDDPLTLSSAGLLAVDDPQPEYVSIHGTQVAVTLQENNGIAIIDIADPAAPVLRNLFSAGVVTDRPADLLDDSRISFTQMYPSDVAGQPGAGSRLPDGIGWSDDGTVLFTADEGEANFTGGRGWSGRSWTGANAFDDGGALEAIAVRYAQYPDGRSDAKGIEAEGLALGCYGLSEFLFVSSERGAFVAVYRLDGRNRPRFVQLLPTGIGPEGLLPIPGRNLLVTANEGDDRDGTISIFEGVTDLWVPPADQPRITSSAVNVPWGAVSGLAASPRRDGILYGVPDSALPSAIYTIDVQEIAFKGGIGRVGVLAPVTKAGTQMRYDLEGITVDTSVARPRSNAGFWLASEGDAGATRNILVQVDGQGRVLREVYLPDAIDFTAPRRVTSNGFEGVTVSGDGRYLVVAVQRPFVGDSAVGGLAHTRIARYDLLTNTWDAFFYPLLVSPGTIGLSEIVVVGRSAAGGDVYAVIERDNRLAASANIKRIYTFSFDGLAPVDIATPANASTVPAARVSKTLFRDLLPSFSPYEKVEGLAVTLYGHLWVALDNDGGEVEPRLLRLAHAFSH